MDLINRIKSKSFLKKILLWFLINTLLGTIISFFLSVGANHPFIDIFIASQISTHIISTSSAITGYWLIKKIRANTILKSILKLIPGTTLASILGNILSILITRSIFNIELFPSIWIHFSRMLIPVIIINIIITAISVIIELLTKSKENLLIDLEQAKKEAINNITKVKPNRSLSIKERENYFVIDLNDIIYLSSKGKRTLIHTEEKDYETIQLLKEIEQKLPQDIFIRIHKQFMVNINFISRIQYYEGGRYMAYLKDEDESMLPVGKNITPALKIKLGI